MVSLRLLFPLAALVTCASLAACSAPASSDSATSDSAYTGDPSASPQAACSLRYWGWVLNELQPQLARPIAELSDEQMTSFVAAHPPMEETAHTYSACWTPIFDKYVYAVGAVALHQADVDFVNQAGPDYKSYPRYLAKVAMTPELRRNAKALLALKPQTMSPTDVSTWSTAYDSIAAEVIRPVGIPGPLQYEGVVEPEWTITDAESEYLAVMESARAEPSKDGVYGEWVRDFGKWVFGPPPAVTRSFVFNVAWEPGYDGSGYGLEGLRLENGVPTLPPPVQSFVKRIASARPAALGESDTAAWMSIYNGRAIRALGDLSQRQPVLTQTDALALDVLESVEPAQLRGAFPYGTWLDLMVLATKADGGAAWLDRFAHQEPCLDAGELPVAQDSFTAKTAGLAGSSIAAPHACAN